MHTRPDIPPSTGTERFQHLVERERIIRDARYLTLKATLRHNAPLPVPAQDRGTAKDLRRGRMHPLGRVLWFLGILKERNHPDARELAERLRDLVTEAIDLEFPPDSVNSGRPISTRPIMGWRYVKPVRGATLVRHGRIA